jgi:hypothetical protein
VDLRDLTTVTVGRPTQSTEAQADFEAADVCEWLESTSHRFHAVLAFHDAICWLPHLDWWANGITRVLEPGGCSVLVEIHLSSS